MKIKNSITLIVSLLAIGLLNGCATTGFSTTEYDSTQSKAWNLTHSVGMSQLKDSEVSSDQKEGNLQAAVDVALDVNRFMTKPRFDMSFGEAFGVSLLGLLNEKEAHGERSTVVAWVPSDEASNRESAHFWLSENLKDATLSAMSDLDIKGEVDFHNKRVKTLFSDPYDETRITGFKEDGSECGAFYRTYPDTVSEEQAIPDFILSGETGYQVNAGNKTVYPKVMIYCLSDNLDPFLEFVSQISKHLPDTVYFYTRMLENNGHELPPIVHDHGKALLFLTKE